MTKDDILKDWEWLFNNVSETLHCFDNEDEITDFVTCKIESVIATRQEVDVEGKIFVCLLTILLCMFFNSACLHKYFIYLPTQPLSFCCLGLSRVYLLLMKNVVNGKHL